MRLFWSSIIPVQPRLLFSRVYEVGTHNSHFKSESSHTPKGLHKLHSTKILTTIAILRFLQSLCIFNLLHFLRNKRTKQIIYCMVFKSISLSSMLACKHNGIFVLKHFADTSLEINICFYSKNYPSQNLNPLKCFIFSIHYLYRLE